MARHRLRNTIHSLLLLGVSLALLGMVGHLVAGELGVWLLGGLVLFSALGGFSLPTEYILRLFRAIPLTSRHVPALYAALVELSRRAKLPRAPALYYMPTPLVNAFTLGTRSFPVVVLTDGLLRALNPRELTAVLAHEIAHIQHGDLGIMRLADAITRLTTIAAWAGQLLLLLNLPLILLTQIRVPWTAIVLLILSPALTALAQLALSRTREYEADRAAVLLTGDPEGLASALAKIERVQARWYEWLLFPGRGVPHPSWLRTHPPTERRIRRLAEIHEEMLRERLRLPEKAELRLPIADPTHLRAPRWRWSGLWW
ncbi:MAG: Zn-dependent protease [Candidatus Poribacteria bacterium]|nr:MAG: Zn-dependent protease [Candidatus Poribacteria bacterium]